MAQMEKGQRRESAYLLATLFHIVQLEEWTQCGSAFLRRIPLYVMQIEERLQLLHV